MFVPLWIFLVGITVAWFLGLVTGYEIGFSSCLNALKRMLTNKRATIQELNPNKWDGNDGN